ncbi:MAG TPA: efflux transporter outer membrane subunit [Usitatibacter sp.]|nr:efflux transporter outer membrane subunit [Usitatibacter sp.]
MAADEQQMTADKNVPGIRGAIDRSPNRLQVFLRPSAFHLRPSAFSKICVTLVLAGCAIGPNYEKPQVETPAQFKEAGDWVVAQPADTVPKGKWWELFNDPLLSALMEQVQVDNQTLRAAEARYTSARASVAAARSGLFPTVGAGADAGRSRRGGANSQNYSVTLDARWELDLWGRVRRLIEASRAGEEASAADLENVRLSIRAELATNYFQLRVTDVQRELLDDTVKAFEASFKIAQNRYAAGVAARVDVVQAESQMKSVQAQAIDLRVVRAQLEHAIATLVGKAPAAFSIEPVKFQARIPEIPPGLPSTLLQRRPDVAAAERRMAAANARIGVAQAAYFPSLALTGSGGFASSALSTLFSAPSRIWSLGLGLAGNLLDFGARSAEVDISRAAYDETVANYRATVLQAMQEVEDNLAAVHWLAEESAVQQDAARLARESVALTVNQYKAGTVGYLNVVQVQATQLSEERSTVQLLGRRLAAAVALIRALGGDWGTVEPRPNS